MQPPLKERQANKTGTVLIVALVIILMVLFVVNLVI
jgi:hypothetical protein